MPEFKYHGVLQGHHYVKTKLQEMVGFTLKPQSSVKLIQKKAYAWL